MSFMLLGILNSQAAAGGGGAAYDLLTTYTETTTNSSLIDFTSIDQSYKHLQIRIANSNSNGMDTTAYVQFNSVTSSQYNNHYLRGNGESVSSGWAGSVSTGFYVDGSFGQAAVAILEIQDYSSSSKNTTMRWVTGDSANTYPAVRLGSGLWDNTSAVTSIQLTPSFGSITAGTRISIYGIKG